MHKYKKILQTCVIVFSFLPVLASAGFTPVSVSVVNDIVSVDITSPLCYAVYLPETVEAQTYFDEMENCFDVTYANTYGSTWFYVVSDVDGDEFAGVYHLVKVNDGGAGCVSLDYENCLLHSSYQGETINVVFGSVDGLDSGMVASVILSGIGEVSLGLSLIFVAVLLLVICVFLFRKGLRWIVLTDPDGMNMRIRNTHFIVGKRRT